MLVIDHVVYKVRLHLENQADQAHLQNIWLLKSSLKVAGPV